MTLLQEMKLAELIKPRLELDIWKLTQPLIPQAAVGVDRVVKSTGGKN